MRTVPSDRNSLRVISATVAPSAASHGGTVADVARDLFLSEGTVRNYLSAAIGKTGARTRAEAVRLALDNGWLLS